MALKQLFRSHHKHNKISSKRVITCLAFLLMAIGYCVDLFTDLSPSVELFDSMSYIVLGGLGFTASEAFTATPIKEKKPKTPITPTPDEDYDDFIINP